MSDFMDDSLFDNYKKKQTEKAANKGGGNKDDRFLSLEIGSKYRFRLLWWEDAADKRGSPWVGIFKHGVKLNNGSWKSAICSYTNMENAKEAWNACKVCQESTKFYKLKEATGSIADEEMYKRFKKSYEGYALVYVISDSKNEENNGKFKIVKFKAKIHKFFEQQIFAIGDGIDEDEVVGRVAFNPESGRDLLINVTKSGQWPEYNCSFSSKSTQIACFESKQQFIKLLDKEARELRFNDLRQKFDSTKVDEFFSVLTNESFSADTSNGDEEADLQVKTPKAPAKKVVAAPAPEDDDEDAFSATPVKAATKAAVPAPVAAPKVPAAKSKADEELDDLLGELS